MHYYCEGDCGGVSEEPGVCKAEDCEMQGEELIYCDCNNPEDHIAPELPEEPEPSDN